MSLDVPPLTGTLARLHRPHGRRLGIAAVPGVTDGALQVAAEALEAHGSRPGRRLARLQPAPGRDTVTDDEAAWFLRRFGHEYTVVLWPSGRPAPDEVREAAAAAGVAFVEA